jgi:hypothetical protein
VNHVGLFYKYNNSIIPDTRSTKHTFLQAAYKWVMFLNTFLHHRIIRQWLLPYISILPFIGQRSTMHSCGCFNIWRWTHVRARHENAKGVCVNLKLLTSVVEGECLVSFALRPLYLHWIGSWVDPRAQLEVLKKKTSLFLTGNRSAVLRTSAVSTSL